MRLSFISIIFSLLWPIGLMAEKSELALNSPVIDTRVEINNEVSYRGWEYLVGKLLRDGIPKSTVDEIYLNKKMPAVDVIYFKLNPKETKSMYSTFKNKSLVKKAHQYIKDNQELFEKAERNYKVNKNVIASIMLIESHFGSNTGNNLTINRLSRVGSIASPENIAANFRKLSKENPKITYKQVEDRALYLEKSFYPEVLALIKIAKENQIDLLELKGSYAGAFGIPQFLPSTFMNYAVDGNNDGKISLFHKSDAVLSVGNYLSHSGWKDHATQKEKEAVIWKYNRSEPYIDAVLYLTNELGKK